MTQASEQIARQYAAGSVNQKLWRDIIVNVLDYHKGGLDITAAIKAAQNDAAPNGQVVLPRGNYNLSEKVDIFCHFDAKSATITTVGELDLAASIVPDVFNILYPDKDIWLPTVIKGGVTTPAKQLGAKADKSYVDSQDSLKADKTYVDTQNALKADTTYVDQKDGVKADKTYVDTQIASVASGSPKGVYATLAALQSAFPTGNTNIYLVTADGKWYYWNGSAWTAGGLYQSAGVSKGSITPELTTFFEFTGKNLFNKNKVTNGYYADFNNGNLAALASYGVSDFIQVLPNTVYTKNKTQQIPFYDINKVYISGVDAQKTFTTPSNCYFVRVNFELIDANILQLELGKSATIYEPFQEVLTSTIIKDNSRIVKLTNGKNLVDKIQTYKDVYIQFGNGSTAGVAGYYATDYIEVVAGETYTKSVANQFAYYDANKQYVSGVTDGTSTFTVPIGVKYARFTIQGQSNLDAFQLEKGNTKTYYEPYKLVIPDSYLNKEERTYSVAKNGGDYAKISQAIDAVIAKGLSYDAAITIHPGEYEEVITNLKDDKKVSLIGVSKRDCILINKSGDYYYSPLQISGRNYIKNMTIIANHDNVATVPWPPSYAVHYDYDGAGETVFEDCIFKSYQNAALGIGMHQDQTLIFKNCDFYKDGAYDGGSFYFHNAVASGVTNQKLVLINCRVIAEQGAALRMDDANIGSGDGLGNDMDATFINCMFYSKELGLNCMVRNTAPIGAGTLVGRVKLNPMSYGNNLAILNA